MPIHSSPSVTRALLPQPVGTESAPHVSPHEQALASRYASAPKNSLARAVDNLARALPSIAAGVVVAGAGAGAATAACLGASVAVGAIVGGVTFPVAALVGAGALLRGIAKHMHLP